MSLVKTIVGIIILVIILHLIFSWFFPNGTTITGMEPATKASVIAASKLPDNNTSNFTYSTWFYINDWNYEFGKPKILLERKNSADITTFKISLGATENNIDIDVLCYSSSGSGSSWGGGLLDGGGSIAPGPWIGGGGVFMGDASCPAACLSCRDGSGITGGVGLTNGMCTSHCSKQTTGVTGRWSGWTGTPTCNSVPTGTDCSGCPASATAFAAGTSRFFNIWDWLGKCDGSGSHGYGCCSGSLDFASCTDVSCSNCHGAAGLKAQELVAAAKRMGTEASGVLFPSADCSAAQAGSNLGGAACGECRALGASGLGGATCAACCASFAPAQGFTTQGTGKWHKCTIRNFPLQKWVNLTVSLYGRTLDVYIDGKLVRTCILPGVAKSGTGGSILVTPGKGFSGWTSQTRYFADATNPQEAYGIYKEGYGGSIIGNLFNKYRVRVSFLEDNQAKGSFEL